MNLKNQYKRLFEGRAAFAKANNLKISDSLLKEDAKPDYLDMDKDGDTEEPMKSALKENPNETFDYQYFIEQTEALIDTLEEYEQEIGTSLEMTADNTGESYWKQTENQTLKNINLEFYKTALTYHFESDENILKQRLPKLKKIIQRKFK